MLSFILLVLTILQLSTMRSIKTCEGVKNCESCANVTDISGVRCEWCLADRTCKSFLINNCPLEDRIPHPYNCPTSVDKTIYSEDFARNIVLPLIGGTHSNSGEQLNRLLKSCFTKVRLINTYEVSCDSRTNLTSCYAYMVYLPSHEALSLVFRGSRTLYQITDQMISFFLYKKVPYGPAGGHVDHYYVDAFYKLWIAGMRNDFEREIKVQPRAKIWCFGHSLGGGLASLAATHIAYTYHKSDNVRLTTFGQPRIGDIEFAMGHDKLVPNSLRIIHGQDPVPAIPPRSFQTGDFDPTGAFHHKFEIWYPFKMQKGSVYQVGRNADEFSKSISVTSWLDHLNYFEIQLDKFPEIGCRNNRL